jgi:hypothetical protein
MHRSWRRLATHLWPGNNWVVGNDRFASVSYCPRGGPTVMLHPTLAEAIEARQTIDQSACGGACVRRHAVIDLEREVERRLGALL